MAHAQGGLLEREGGEVSGVVCLGVSCISPPLPARKFDVYLWSGRALSHRQDAGRLKAFMFIALCERYDKRCFPAVGGDSNITNREYLGGGEKWKGVILVFMGLWGNVTYQSKGCIGHLSGTAGPVLVGHRGGRPLLDGCLGLCEHYFSGDVKILVINLF